MPRAVITDPGDTPVAASSSTISAVNETAKMP
jgi:hypothetical protein